MHDIRRPSLEQLTEWVTGLFQGDLFAFQQLFESFTPPLRRFAALSVPMDIAEDIVQDVLFDLWQRKEQITVDGAGLPKYLFGAVRNRVRHHLRHQHVVEKVHKVHGGYAHEEHTPMPALMPDRDIAANDIHDALIQAMGALSELQRAVLTLRWAHGMSYPEIAQALDISSNAAMLHGSRARAVLRPLMEPFLKRE